MLNKATLAFCLEIAGGILVIAALSVIALVFLAVCWPFLSLMGLYGWLTDTNPPAPQQRLAVVVLGVAANLPWCWWLAHTVSELLGSG